MKIVEEVENDWYVKHSSEIWILLFNLYSAVMFKNHFIRLSIRQIKRSWNLDLSV